jgi:hypothetical protein
MEQAALFTQRNLRWLKLRWVIPLIALAFLLLPSTPAEAVVGWSTKAPMPTARNGLSLGAHDGIIYAAGGWNGFHRSAVEAYDTGTNTWNPTPKASMLGPQTHAASGVISGILYLAGGTDLNGVEVHTVTAYDIAKDSWSSKLSMSNPPPPRRRWRGDK